MPLTQEANNRIVFALSNDINAKEAQVNAAIALLDEGATVPFIARYRKEVTGGLDDSQLRLLQERLDYLRDMEERRAVVIQSIEAQGKMTDELRLALNEAQTKQRIEDLYLPYKPKRRTRAQIAREAGLEPLAERLFEDSSLDPEKEATEFLNDEKGILEGNTINTEKGKNTIELQLDYIPKGELYIVFENINYIPDSKKSSTKYTLKVENAEKTVSETVQDIKNAYYIKKDNLVFNFGESNKRDNKIKITIDANKGKFTFDKIKVVSIPYEKIDEQAQKLKKSEFENIVYSNNRITGNIKNQKDGILQLSIPFSSGWKCYVDGQAVETIKVNTAFIGIPLKSGEHSIEFVYSTPGLNLGIISSVIGIIGLMILVNIDKNNKRKKKLIEKKC